jgi:hypothetical protein
MTIGTIFTLFVTPAVYTYIARDHRARTAAAPVAPTLRPEPERTPAETRKQKEPQES